MKYIYESLVGKERDFKAWFQEQLKKVAHELRAVERKQ
jgi:hypothetical protein